jgi:hypothetical protein
MRNILKWLTEHLHNCALSEERESRREAVKRKSPLAFRPKRITSYYEDATGEKDESARGSQRDGDTLPGVLSEGRVADEADDLTAGVPSVTIPLPSLNRFVNLIGKAEEIRQQLSRVRDNTPQQ